VFKVRKTGTVSTVKKIIQLGGIKVLKKIDIPMRILSSQNVTMKDAVLF
jgi:hypothetical protein